MPFDVYTKLYDTIVWPIISYGAAIWGTKEYSTINAVHHRACRFFLGIGKYAPNAAINGDMGWIPPSVRQWKTVLNHWFRLNNMEHGRLNNHIFRWANRHKDSRKNLCFRVENELTRDANVSLVCDQSYSMHTRKQISEKFQSYLFENFTRNWFDAINSNTGNKVGLGGNKLRTYKLFKETYDTEPYVNSQFLQRPYRSALAKFRCGVAPLKIEKGRYNSLPVIERTCFHCETEVEDEIHVITRFSLYQNIRSRLYEKATSLSIDFIVYNDTEKLKFVSSNPEIVKYSAKACYDILAEKRIPSSWLSAFAVLLFAVLTVCVLFPFGV